MLLSTIAVGSGAVAYKAVSLIGVGAALSLGFWAGKKLTNRIDVFLYQRSKEYKTDIKSMKSREI